HQRLNRTAETNLIIYDPLKVTLDEADFDIIYDTDGRPYTTELLPINQLTLFKLFDEIFENRCDFADWDTNLPDFAITRADFRAGQPLIATINGIIGTTEPDYNELGNVLWIRDGTG